MARRRRDIPCYTSVRRNLPGPAATLVTPWALPKSLPAPGSERFGAARADESEELARLKERLTLGLVRLPRVSPTVSGRLTSDRVERALISLRPLEAGETPATAYDSSIAAGPDHILVAVNFKVMMLDKKGASLAEADLLSWFKSALPAHTPADIVFDPRIVFDQHDGRWILVASAVHYDDFTSPFLLLSISRTADPRGDWWTWAFAETGRPKPPWPDHPSLGVDAHALYVSANLIDPGSVRLRIIPKQTPYTGGAISYTDFLGLRDPVDAVHSQREEALTVFPCHTWGSPGAQFLVSTRRYTSQTVERSITLWTVSDPAGAPQLTNQSLTVAPYALAPPSATQQGGPLLATGDARIRNAVYNGGSLWCSFATAYQSGATVAAARWYQIDPATRTLVQEGVFAVADVHHCYPAIVPDIHGNATLVVGRTAATERISVHVSARRSNDPLHQMPASQLLRAGASGHDNPDKWGRNRWGDYHAASLDPSDGVTVWVCGGYPRTNKIWGLTAGAVQI